MNPPASLPDRFQGASGFQQWESTLAEQCGAFHPEPPQSTGIETFKGAIVPARVTGRGYAGARIDSNCPHIHRGIRDIRRDGQDFFYIVQQIAGTAVMDQEGVQSTMAPGDLVVLDITRPSDFHFTGMSEQISLLVPRHRLQPSPSNGRLLLNRKIAAQTRVGQVAGLLTRQFFDTNEADDDLDAVMEALIALIRPRLTDSESTPVTYGQKLQLSAFERARRYIEEALTDFELTPDMIARELGTSKRTLHRLFAQQGLSISRYILDRRLDRCAGEFESCSDLQKISAVALTWGFNDISHFSRAFKARFGTSPRDFRNRTR